MFTEIAITGTRRVPVTFDCTELFENTLRPFIVAPNVVRRLNSDHVARVFVGGAVGIDTEALYWLADHTMAKIVVVVPWTVADQPINAQEAIYHAQTIGRVEDVVELKADHRGPDAYHARNRYMVDHAELVIGFPLRITYPDPRQGGTWATLNYADSRDKPVLIHPY